MVFTDLSTYSSDGQQSENRVPAVMDRILAFMIDLVIFSPVFTLILSEVFKKLQLRFYIDEGSSTEFVVLVGVAIIFVLVITVILQTLFLLYLGATPGKYLMKMRIISLDHKSPKMTITQAFLRSSLWALEWLFLGIPFLELFSDRRRRPLHDRASDTMVVTLKRGVANIPFEMESQFVRQMLLVTSFIFIFWGIVIVGQFYRKAVHGDFRKAQLIENHYLCDSVSQSVGNGTRIDRAVALFLAGEISSECLGSEADFVLWSENEASKPWAYLAKMIMRTVSNRDEAAFLEKICTHSQESEECQIAKAFRDSEPKVNESWQSETGNLLALMTEYKLGKYEKVHDRLIKIADWKGFQDYIQKVRVKLLWSMSQQTRALGAFDVAREMLSFENKLDIASWVCLEQMDSSCSASVRPQACEDVLSQVVAYVNQEGHSGQTIGEVNFPLETTLALIQEQECRGTATADRAVFLRAFEKYPELESFVKALGASELPTAGPRGQLKPTRFAKLEEVAGHGGMRSALRERILIAMINTARKTDEMEKIVKLWDSEGKETWSSIKLAQKILGKSLELKTWAMAASFADRIPSAISKRYGLDESRAIAYYQAGSDSKAWEILKSTSDGLGVNNNQRSPASSLEAAKEKDIQQIRQDLMKKFGKH